MSRPWLLVTGDFAPSGGMDRANHALASHLLRRGDEVHLVAHQVSPDLEALGAEVHLVRRPLASNFLAEPLLDHAGRRWAARLTARGGRVVVNGGNCRSEGTNWIHYVHAAWSPPSEAGLRGAKNRLHRLSALRNERAAIARARLLISNSERTTRDLVARYGVAEGRVERVYLGVDRERFRAPRVEERARLRAELGWEEPIVLFVGGLGDRRKGFDRALEVWTRRQRDPRWDLRLVHAGRGPANAEQEARAQAAALGGRVEFLGFRADVERLLQAADLLVSPVRYEAYGLGVHEALCCGLPAIVSRSAGVAERYPDALSSLLLRDPESARELEERIEGWRAEPAAWRARAEVTGAELRARGWDEVSRDLVAVIEARS